MTNFPSLYVAAIHAKEYLKSIPISLTDKFMNNLAMYFTEHSLDLKHLI